MWFDAETSGLIHGIMGGAIGVCCGIIGGIIGVVGGRLARNGREMKYKKLLLTLSVALIVIAVLLLSVGIVAILIQQPFHVWVGFVFSGGITITVSLPPYFYLKNFDLCNSQNSPQATEKVL